MTLTAERCWAEGETHFQPPLPACPALCGLLGDWRGPQGEAIGGMSLLRGTGQEHGVGGGGEPSSACWKCSAHFYTRMAPLFLWDPHMANCPALTPSTLSLPWYMCLTQPGGISVLTLDAAVEPHREVRVHSGAHLCL